MLKREVKKGVRVHINNTEQFILNKTETRLGTIVGISQEGFPMVLLDGYKTRMIFHPDFCDVVPPVSEEVQEEKSASIL